MEEVSRVCQVRHRGGNISEGHDGPVGGDSCEFSRLLALPRICRIVVVKEVEDLKIAARQA